jgi:hypothetical protein
MSEQEGPTKDQLDFSKRISEAIEKSIHYFIDKQELKDKLNDVVVCLNWKPDYQSQPIPKMVIETLRDPKSPDYDPIRQALEISDIMNMGSVHVLRQFLFGLIRQNQEMSQQLQQMAGLQAHKPDLKIIVPGQ